VNVRTKTLAALGCVASLAALLALLPMVWPIASATANDLPTLVPSVSGPPAVGSIDGVHRGSILSAARGQDGLRKTLRVARDPLGLDGWALTDRKAPAQAIVYRIDAGPWYAATYGTARPDVAVALHDPALAWAGFFAHIPIATTAPGHHLIHVAVDSGTQLEPLGAPIAIDLR